MCSLENLSERFSDYVVQYKDFQFLKSIGSGGFSEVFLANYLPTNKLCAVKKLKFKELTGDNLNLYYREIEILAKCSHPFILELVGFTTKRPYIVVTEYVENGSLYDALRWKSDPKPLNGTQKTIIALGIASGMDRIHSLGIIHRDMKSLNILLDRDNLPRIIDFGLSRFQTEKDEFMTTNIGTPHWMAPELFTSQVYTNKIDVYAYGITLWEILTNSSPFKGKTHLQIMNEVYQKGKRPPIPMRTQSALKALINKCWAQNPDDRPTFHKIYKAFAKGEILFDDAKKEDIVNFAKRMKVLIKKKISGQERKRSIFDSNDSVNYKNLFDVNSPDIEKSLENLVAKAKPSNAYIFYKAIEPHITQSTSPNILSAIYAKMAELFATDIEYYNSFINLKVYEKIAFYVTGIDESLLDVYLYLFTNDPVLVSNMHINVISKLTAISPRKVLRLINVLTSSPSFLSNHQQEFWAVTDVLFTKSNDFIAKGCAIDLIEVIYTLYTKSAAFQNAKRDDFFLILDFVLERGSDDAEAALDLICSDPTISFVITENVLIKLILDPKLCEKALIALTKMDIEPTEAVLSAMLEASKTSELACLILCERSMNPTVAYILAINGSKWLNGHFPNIESAMRLLTVIVSHQNIRDYLPADVAKLLCDAANTTGVVFDAIFPVLKKLTISPQLKELLSTNFLESYYNISFQKGESGISSALYVTDKMASAGYCQGFVSLLPYLKKMINDEDWAEYAMPTLAEMSAFEEMKQPIIDEGFPSLVEKYNETNHSVFTDLFFENIC